MIATQGQAHNEGGNLQPGIDHFLSVEWLKQNLDVVVKGKSDIGQVRTQEDQHGPPNIDQIVQNSVQHGFKSPLHRYRFPGHTTSEV